MHDHSNGTGTPTTTRNYSQSVGEAGLARSIKVGKLKAAHAQSASPQSSPVPEALNNHKAKPKVPSQRPPSYKEHQRSRSGKSNDSHAQSLRNGLGSGTASMTASHTPTPAASGTTSPTPPQPANGADKARHSHGQGKAQAQATHLAKGECGEHD